MNELNPWFSEIYPVADDELRAAKNDAPDSSPAVSTIFAVPRTARAGKLAAQIEHESFVRAVLGDPTEIVREFPSRLTTEPRFSSEAQTLKTITEDLCDDGEFRKRFVDTVRENALRELKKMSGAESKRTERPGVKVTRTPAGETWEISKQQETCACPCPECKRGDCDWCSSDTKCERCQRAAETALPNVTAKVGAYIRAMRKGRVLSDERESELAQLFQRGKQAAKNLLHKSNIARQRSLDVGAIMQHASQIL